MLPRASVGVDAASKGAARGVKVQPGSRGKTRTPPPHAGPHTSAARVRAVAEVAQHAKVAHVEDASAFDALQHQALPLVVPAGCTRLLLTFLPDQEGALQQQQHPRRRDALPGVAQAVVPLVAVAVDSPAAATAAGVPAEQPAAAVVAACAPAAAEPAAATSSARQASRQALPDTPMPSPAAAVQTSDAAAGAAHPQPQPQPQQPCAGRSKLRATSAAWYPSKGGAAAIPTATTASSAHLLDTASCRSPEEAAAAAAAAADGATADAVSCSGPPAPATPHAAQEYAAASPPPPSYPQSAGGAYPGVLPHPPGMYSVWPYPFPPPPLPYSHHPGGPFMGAAAAHPWEQFPMGPFPTAYAHHPPRMAQPPALFAAPPPGDAAAAAAAAYSIAGEGSPYHHHHQHQYHSHAPPPLPPPTPAGSDALAWASGADSVCGGSVGGGVPACPADTVTVSAHSAVKDAAGAVAKVLERRGSCMLLALKRRGETDAECSHVAAKTLAVSRFYVNTITAGVATAPTATAAAGGTAHPHPSAARAGQLQQQPQQGGGGGGDAGGAPAEMQEVTFVPFTRCDLEGAFGFLVVRTPPGMLDARLPTARHQSTQLALPPPAAAGGAGSASAAADGADADAPPPVVLKAAAGTDVQRLSNALVHHVLERGRCVLQLAGAGACHTSLRALERARGRLAARFKTGLAAAAAFSTEDTTGALGRSTVFLRIDVVRCALGAVEAAMGDLLGSCWEGGGGGEGVGYAAHA